MTADPRYVVNPELAEAFNAALDRERRKHEERVNGKHTVRIAEYQRPNGEKWHEGRE